MRGQLRENASYPDVNNTRVESKSNSSFQYNTLRTSRSSEHIICPYPLKHFVGNKVVCQLLGRTSLVVAEYTLLNGKNLATVCKAVAVVYFSRVSISGWLGSVDDFQRNLRFGSNLVQIFAPRNKRIQLTSLNFAHPLRTEQF